MKLNIKLKNESFCEGCPCLKDVFTENVNVHGALFCKYYDRIVANDDYDYCIRPGQCIKENGL